METTIKDICTFRGHGLILRAPGAPKPSDMAMSSRAMIAKTQRSIIFKAQRNWTINSINRKIEAKIKDICIFRGHMVVLGAPGVPKPKNKAKDMIVDINKSIISKANPNGIMYS